MSIDKGSLMGAEAVVRGGFRGGGHQAGPLPTFTCKKIFTSPIFALMPILA